MRKIVISGPPPVQVLDVTGPLEVFSNVPDYQVEIVSSDGTGQLRTNRGITLSGTVSRTSVSSSIDTLVIAGGPGAECGEYDPDYVRWIGDTAGRRFVQKSQVFSALRMPVRGSRLIACSDQELERIAKEEDRRVVSDQVPVAFLNVEVRLP